MLSSSRYDSILNLILLCVPRHVTIHYDNHRRNMAQFTTSISSLWSWVCFLDHLTPFDSKERKNESPVEISYPDAHQLPNLNELSRMHRKMTNPYRYILKDPARHPH